MTGLTLNAKQIGRDFNRRPVFRDISFTVSSPGSIAVTGLNGAGKSTLVKILAGVMSPTAGTVRYDADGNSFSADDVREHLGFVSPYLSLYDEFTAEENLRLLNRIRSGVEPDAGTVEQRLRQVDLWNRRGDVVGTFSSGMKQRLKYALALLHAPTILILDEPTANLDAEGIEMVRAVALEQRARGILIVATNDEEEAGWCADRIHLKGSGGARP
jgi:heme exporter protein A